MLIATDYQILRDISAHHHRRYAVTREPVRTALITDEELFTALGQAMIESRTVYFQDRIHDWDWSNGRLRYYGRQGTGLNLLVVFAEHDDKRTPFCGQCGTPAQTGCEHQ